MKTISTYIAILFSLVWTSVDAQSGQSDYLKSNQSKKQFDKQEWNKLKGKMINESSATPNSGVAGNGGEIEFDPSNFNTEEGTDGSAYEYEPEEYKGEYSEFQNSEDDANADYEYDEDYDNYEHQDNPFYGNSEHNDGTYNKYDKPKDQKSKKIKKKKKKVKPSNNRDMQMSQGAISVFKIIAIIVAIGLLAGLLYYLFINYQGGDKGAKVEIDFEDRSPTEIPKTELERRLEEALAREDFREAIRIYFIFIIKDLAEKEWIRWERKKTNISYLMEMRSKPQYQLFNETVSVFEVVWYGNYVITKSNYMEVEPKFKKMLAEVSKG